MPFKYNPYSGELDWVLGPGSGTATIEFSTDSGTANPTGAGVITLAGGTGINTSGAANTVTINLDDPVIVDNGGTGRTSLTDGAVLVGDGTNAVEQIGPLTDGQLLIGDTAGVSPAAATLTAGANITITNGAGSIEIAANAGGDMTVTPLDDTDSPYTVLGTDEYLSCDVSGGTLTIELENAPSTGRVVKIKDAGGDAATNNISVTTAGGVVTIDGSTTYTMNTNYQAISVLFNGTSYEVF